MLTFAALSGPLPRIGVIVAALLASVAVLDHDDRRRAGAMLTGSVIALVLLLDDVWDSSHLKFVHEHPAEGVVVAIIALGALSVAAALIRRVPWAIAPLAVLTLPFRVPITTGGDTSNLLVPLYFVISAAAVGWAVPVLVPGLVNRWPRVFGPASAGLESAAGHDGADGGVSAHTPERRPAMLFEKLLCAFIVVYAVQLLYSPGAQGALPSGFEKGLENEIFFYLPFAVMLSFLRDLNWTRELLIRCLLITVGLALIFAVIGFGERASGHLLFSSKLAESNQLHSYFAVNSVFFDPDIFGRYLALTMVLLAAVLLYDKRPRVQIGVCVALAVLWGCLLFTLSRSSIFALLLGMAVLAALRWRARPILYAAAGLVVLGAIALALHPTTFGLNQGLEGASGGRGNLLSGGLHLFSERPFFGWGAGSFQNEYTRVYPLSAASVADSHNIPVTVLAEQGIVGILFYVALVVSALIALFKGVKGDPYRVAIAATFLALLLHTLLYADFLEDPTTWVLLAVGGALAAGRTGLPDRGPAPARSGLGDGPAPAGDVAGAPVIA